VKPAKFDYHAPTSVDEALALLMRYGGEAKILAGGQSLVPLLNFRLSRPAALIDINRIPELAYIRVDNGTTEPRPAHSRPPTSEAGLTVIIGAMTRQRTIEFAPVVAERVPLLTEATRWVGHLPIRSRGTIGGSLAHADPSAEYPTVLTALGGSVVARGPKGERTIAAGELFQTYLTTSLGPDEILVEVRLPAPPAGAGYAFEELARRHGDFALVGIAAVIARQGERCTMARLATSGAGPVPLRLRAAEEILERDGLGDAAIEAAGRRASELVSPDSDIHASADYRRHLAGVLTQRAVKRALTKAARV
jgi:aerobic carbon-monoxide dehydrogenase medium subunit